MENKSVGKQLYVFSKYRCGLPVAWTRVSGAAGCSMTRLCEYTAVLGDRTQDSYFAAGMKLKVFFKGMEFHNL